MTQRRIRFAIVGSGWRSEFFLRIARALPERFEVTALATRSPQTGATIERQWGVRTVRSAAEVARASGADSPAPDFTVVSVPREAAPAVITDLVHLGQPVLTETPPGVDVAAMLPLVRLVAEGARIQVAEQYHRSPLLAAQLAVAASGRLGTISQAHVAQCHDYHGVSVLRRALGVGFDDVTITADVFRSPLAQGPDRHGDPADPTLRFVTAEQTTARFDFGDRLGVYDFAPQQYFSWIRANRLLVRGDRGEVHDREVRWMRDARTPVTAELRRVEAGVGGNLEGQFVRGYLLGDEWTYTNPFVPARLMDDELAIVHLLVDMSAHVAGGDDVYSLADAAHDHYLALLMQQTARSGIAVRSTPQAWSA